MLKKLLLTTAVSGLMLSAAVAQTPTPSPSTPSQPSATTPAPAPSGSAAKPDTSSSASKSDTSKSSAASAGSTGPQFVAEQGTDHFVFSKFNGTDVVGADNKKIGDINDVVFDKNHMITAYVVGVGGFLGIGEKNVAIAPSAFQPWHDPNDKTAADDPNSMKLKVSWTKDQLKNAPDFKYYKAPSSTASSGSSATTGAGGMGSRGAR